jgi:uncharacterized protein (DUF1810 family)
MSDLSRFIEAQKADYPTALAELQQGRKQTHWMWYILPQLAGLGRSATARFYGIKDLAEARAYLSDPVLAPRLAACMTALISHPQRSAEEILGPVDALKLRSCATLFLIAGKGTDVADQMAQVLSRFYAGAACPVTLELLNETS